MEIELTRGFKAAIDDDDYAIVGQFKWRAHSAGDFVYAARTVGASCVLMHRFITGAKPGYVVDHIDHDTLNNRRSNLRVCSQAENRWNSKVHSHSSSGVKNVMREKDSSGYLRWRVIVRVDGKRHRKWFSDLEKAKTWAESARERLHGQFAYKAEEDKRR